MSELDDLRYANRPLGDGRWHACQVSFERGAGDADHMLALMTHDMPVEDHPHKQALLTISVGSLRTALDRAGFQLIEKERP
jgi:hypothetical protein